MKKKKIGVAKAALIIAAMLAFVFGIIFLVYLLNKPSSTTTSNKGSTSTTNIYADTEKSVPTNSNTTYTVLSSSYYSSNKIENLFVTSTEELKMYLLKCFSDSYYSRYPKGDENRFFNSMKADDSHPYVLQYFDEEFFKNHNLAIYMYNTADPQHDYSIVSVTKENGNGTINIKDEYHTMSRSGGAVLTEIEFIILDKSIKNVNYDIYKTTIDDSVPNTLIRFINIGIYISAAVIAIVSILVVAHNRKIDSKTEMK